jgi:hypothetical protein
LNGHNQIQIKKGELDSLLVRGRYTLLYNLTEVALNYHELLSMSRVFPFFFCFSLGISSLITT